MKKNERQETQTAPEEEILEGSSFENSQYAAGTPGGNETGGIGEEVAFGDDNSGKAGTSSAADLIEELRAQSDENYQRYLRTQADFDNFRRRSRQEKEDFAKYASGKIMEQLLPVLDNFDRALDTGRETKDLDSLIKGLDMIFRQFDQVLEQEGLQKMNTIGEPFNPEFHQAIMQVESEEYEEGIVVEEVQKGYMLKDRVLRPAMVKVSG